MEQSTKTRSSARIVNNKRMIKHLATMLLFLCGSLFSKELPQLVFQQSIDELEQVYSSPDGGTYLVQDGEQFILIDQISKLQLASIKMIRNNAGSPSNGKVIMLNDYDFLLLQPNEILQVHILLGQIDTLFNSIEFPEFVVGMTLKGDSELLVATKIYRESKDGTVSFSTVQKQKNEEYGEHEVLVYDQTKNCRLHLVNLKDKSIALSKPIAENITALYAEGNSVLAGTFDSEILELDMHFNLLQKHALPESIKTPVHTIKNLGESYLVLAHIAPKYLTDRASGTLVLDTFIQIPLVMGVNNLEVYASNALGMSSPKEYLSVFNNTSHRSQLHFIGIGLDHYRQPGHDLHYAVKDIRDMVAALKVKHGEHLLVDTLFNQQATKDNILALKQKLLNLGVNDKVIISFSGHGLLSKEFDYYLATYRVNFLNPQEHGLPYEGLEWLLDGIPPRKKLLLLDACHSGEVDKDELIAINETPKPDGVKGAMILSYKKPNVGLKNSFELMQELFANVNKGTGATIISAAGGNQFAYEKSDIANGVFTYAILELMGQENSVKVNALKNHVGRRVLQLTNGQQRPTSRSETIAFDWEVW